MADPNMSYGKPAAPALSLSEEAKYKKKCRDLKRRISEIESGNENLVTKLARTKRFIQRVRLERAILLEKLEDSAPRRGPGSDGSPSPPPSPALETYSLEPPHNNLNGSPAQSRRSLSPIFSSHDLLDGHDAHDPSHLSATKHSNTAARSSPVPSTKKHKPPKDPNAPKRPKNAFLLFCEIERDSVRAAAEANSTENIDIARELGRVWAEMNADARKPYRDKYDEDRARYEKEVHVYENSKLQTTPNVKAEDSRSDRRDDVRTPSTTGSPAPRAGGFTAVNRA